MLEDGSFHADNKGVFHFGFDKEILLSIVNESGFKNIKFQHINTIHKPQCDYTVFLLTAQK